MTINALDINLIRNSERQKWDDYVLSHMRGIAYQLVAWKDAVENAYGFECPYFLAQEKGTVKGVFPLVKIHLPFSKGNLVSLPYCDAGGILADSKAVAESLLSNALDFANDNGIRFIEIRSAEPFGDISGANMLNTEKVRMLLPLSIDAESLFTSFKSKLRNKIRRAVKEGLKTVIGSADLIEDFYPVFVENMRDLGSPVHSKTWLQSVLQAYGSRAKCCVTYMPDGEPAAGGVILCHSQTVSNPWSSSLRRFNRWKPNMFLYWTFLEYAADQGYAFFDFGRSTPGEGTYKFKEQWGAKPAPLFWHNISLNGSPAEEQSIDKSKFDKAIQYWQKLPVPVTKIIGPRIRKYISL